MNFFRRFWIAFLLILVLPVAAQEQAGPSRASRALEILKSLAEPGETSTPRELIDRGTEALREEFGPGQPILLQALYVMGRSFYDQGDYAGASLWFEKQVELSREILGQEHPDIYIAVNNLAQTLKVQGDLDGARKRFEEVVEALTRKLGAEHPDTLIAVDNLAQTLFAEGDLDGARQRQEQVVEALTRKLGAEHPDTLTAINNLAQTLMAQGNLDSARELQEQVVEARIRKLGGEHPDTLTALANLAEALFSEGDLGGARQRQEQVVEALTRKLSAEHPDTLTAVNNLAVTLLAQGDLDGARQYQELVVKARTRKLGAEHPDTLTALNNLAETLLHQGNLDGARRRFEQVVEARTRKLGADHPDTLTALDNLAETLFAQGDLDGARQREEQVVEARTRLLGAEHPDTLIAIDNFAKTLKTAGDVRGAQHLWELVVETRARARGVESQPKTIEEALTLYNLGEIHRDAGRLEQAREMFLAALEAVEGQAEHFDLSEDLKSQFRFEYRVIYWTAIEVALALERPAEALQILERYRAQSLLTQLSRGTSNFDHKHTELLRNYDELTLKLEDPNLENNSEGKAKLREDQVRVWRALQALRGENDDTRLVTLTEDEIRRQLDVGTVMLAYNVTPQGTHLFIITRENSLEVHTLPVTATDLWVQVRAFFPLLRAIDKTRSMSLEETVDVANSIARLEMSRRLFEELIAPAADHLNDVKRLLILPDGPLYYVPFAALIRPTSDDPRGWQYLVEWKPIHTVQSATVYAELQKRRREATPEDPETTGTLLALGDPSYPPVEHGSEPPPEEATDSAPGRSVPFVVRSAEQRGFFDGLTVLPQTRHEVEAIGHLFKNGPRIYLGADATEEHVKTEAREARYVHIAAHGFADPDVPRNSFLALTIPEGLPPGRENGILQAWEIIDHLRLDADLVVLSACSTAFGPERGGEGLLSLARAFQIAGAHTVAASLWPVADESTAELMIRFYRHLLAGKPKDEALREAQMDLIRGPIEVTTEDGKTETRDFSSPYFWAAFQLIGDWR